jgi:ABC-type transporter Mla subunit MlaD
MTDDERFERIERVTAGLAGQRRQDREEYRELWRETGRQIQALTTKVADFVDASRAADTELRNRLEQVDKEARARDEQLGRRVDSLVSAIGKLVAAMNRQQGLH